MKNFFDQPKDGESLSPFQQRVRDAAQLVRKLQQSSNDATAELDKHFPGLKSMSKELGQDLTFLAEAGSGCDMLAASMNVKDEAAFEDNLSKAMEVNTSKFGSIHRNSVRFALILGLEMGFILAKLQEQDSIKDQNEKDAEFEKFMRGMMVEGDSEGK